MFKVIVETEEQKRELLQASELLHYKRHINLRHPGLQTMAHLYMRPECIEVIPNPDTKGMKNE